MKTKLISLSIALLTGVSVWAQEQATVSVYDDCSENGQTIDARIGKENGYTWVSLDLPSGLKWATCNIGATAPEGYGDYYAWGETETKADYSWETYKYAYDGSLFRLTKYCTDASYGNNGFTDNKTVLEPADDAAHVSWGGSWRMPTDAEWTELRTQCTWTWTTQNGVNGYQVTSKTNGNSIFLPAAGYRYDADFLDVGYVGYYWSSSLYADGPYFAWFVYFFSGSVFRYYYYRSNGQCVRPVCP